MAFDKDAFLAALDTMTVLELNDLVKAVETKFGVSAAAVAVAGGGAAGGAAAPAAEEKTELKQFLRCLNRASREVFFSMGVLVLFLLRF